MRQQQMLGRLLGDEAGLEPQQIIARLIDRHGTGRVLFRNTRHAIKGFPQRHLNISRAATARGLCAALPPSHSRSMPSGEGWTALDPRVPWLRALLG